MMSMHDRYYEPEDDDGEEIEERIEELLKDEHYPYSAENIEEAILNDAMIAHTETLADLLSKGKTNEAGVVLSSLLYTYWEERSRDRVLDNL